MSRLLFLLPLLFLIMSTTSYSGSEPMPLPKWLRVQGAGPREKVWQLLSSKEKELAFHLMEAARAGKSFSYYQSHRHALALRDALISATSAKNLAATQKLLGKTGTEEFLIYTAKFFDAGGPYASSNRKYVLAKVTPAQVETLMKKHLSKKNQAARAEIVKLLTSPGFETQLYPESPDGAGLEACGGNLYELGIKAADVKVALAKKTLDTTLNCRVVQRGGKMECQIHTIHSPGFVGETLKKVVSSLKKAHALALTPLQAQEINSFITYFSGGVVEDFRQANVAWVKDRANSKVDFMMGWVEVYEDWLARIGSWESYVQVIDPEISRRAEALAKSAQYFEDGMPFGKFKKTFPADYSPPAIMVYYFQELANYRSGGYNLPNFDDIRRDVGAKNVIRLPLPGEDEDPDYKAAYEEMLTEFAPQSKIAGTLKHREMIWQNIVLMHEIIGHGSGTYDISKYGKNEDPISGLGSLGSALEEQRADLAALFYLGDKKLIDIGIYKDKAEATNIRNLGYDYYLADFLRRTSGQRTFTEAHQRGHWLFIKKLLEGKAAHWVARDEKSAPTLDNQVLAVLDYDRFHEVTGELFGELQRIKANREEAGLKELFAKYAPLEAIEEPWAKAILARGKDLKINAGYVEQPWRVTADGKYESFGGPTLESIATHWAKFHGEP